MRGNKLFSEVFDLTVHADYKFPQLEIFAFLYAIGAFALGLGNVTLTHNGPFMLILISNLMNIPLYVFLILVLKNLAYGLGNDLQKGKIRTLLPYEAKNIWAAKFLSTIGIGLLLFVGVQLFALFIIAPAMVLASIGTVLLTYLSNIGYVLLLTAIIFLVTLVLKKGVASLVAGTLVYLAIGITIQAVSSFALTNNSITALQIVALFNPSTALIANYGLAPASTTWAPTLTEAAVLLIGNYLIIAFLFFLGYYYFCRWLRA
ncbi:MAG TPA: hypothetical protein VK487_08450 [Candidatus Bathyarchaeia archaeon]|nr:hypothetical protein [Candidatus Bathyarchaeia archaeon]